MTKAYRYIAPVLLLTLLVGRPAEAKIKWWNPFKKKEAVVEQKDTTKKETKYDKLFKKEASRSEGLFTVHMVKGKVYFEVPESLLGREFVMGSTIRSISDNANGVVGSKPLELKHFTFVKVDSTIQMRTISSDFCSSDANIEKALSASATSYIERSFKVDALSNDSTAVVFDATPLFLEHDKTMSPFSEIAAYAQYKREENFKKELSYIVDAKSFSDNVSVTSSMSYTYTMTDVSGKTLLKDKPLTAELTRSILLLPEETYHPRCADYRIGVFFTEREEFTSGRGSKTVYFANRWRLEPSDTVAYRAGAQVEPVKPIVWYIDSNFPEWWKPYIKEAIEQWNEPFAQIGFKNAIVALPFPDDDPEFDPDNIKYNCVRYAPIGVQNATGPSWVDPRSGEIINASVYVYHDIVSLISRWMFVQTAQTDPDVRHAQLPQEVLGDAIRYVISHEIGHTLGFMHNMSGSSVIPVESLRDPEFTQKNGTTTSIMDYARFNYVAQPGDKERGVKLTPPRFGVYDYWLIKWTYTPVFDAADFEEESAITSGWITKALLEGPYYRYGKQQFTSSFFDPRSQNEDLGDDAVAASRYGIANLKYINANFMDWLSDNDPEYEYRTQIFNGILNQYLTYAQHVTLNVGGLYKNEVKEDDVMPRYTNVPAAKQKEALDFLFEMWKDCEWMDDKAVIGRLPVVGKPSNAVRPAIEDLIIITPALCSYSDGIATRELSASQCFTIVADKVFEPTTKGRKLTAAERAFEKNFVYSIMDMGNFVIPGAKKSFAAEDCVSVTAEFEYDSDSSVRFGELMYSPIGGYEWIPRFIFNRGDISKSTLYAVLTYVRDKMNARVGSANADDKAHYQTLINTINYTLK